MEQTVFSRDDFDERTERHDRLHLAFIDFTYFRFGSYGLDAPHSLVYRSLVIRENLYYPFVVDFINGNGSTGFPLHFLDNFTTRPNHGADKFLDRKSTRLNSSHVKISYAVFCLKKK